MDELTRSRIENIKSMLPDAKTYEHNSIGFNTHAIDMKAEVRPIYAEVVRLVFVKNEAGDQWEFDGVQPPDGVPIV